MIVLGEKRDNEHVLHVIIGPETDFHFNMNGQSVMEITEYVQKMQADERCILIVNRCDSEETLIQEISMQQSRMNAMQEFKNVMENAPDGLSQAFPFGQSPSQGKKKTSQKDKISEVNCPTCGMHNTAIIKDGNVFSCKICQEIDEGLKTKDVSISPPPKDLDKIKKEIENKNPNQKKSISRYKRKETIDDDLPPEKK